MSAGDRVVCVIRVSGTGRRDGSESERVVRLIWAARMRDDTIDAVGALSLPGETESSRRVPSRGGLFKELGVPALTDAFTAVYAQPLGAPSVIKSLHPERFHALGSVGEMTKPEGHGEVDNVSKVLRDLRDLRVLGGAEAQEDVGVEASPLASFDPSARGVASN
jgi:hypothetical protein